MRTLILGLCIIIMNTANAAKVLNPGDAAPYKGVLFTMEEEAQLRANDEKLLLLQELGVKYEQKAEIQQERIDLLRQEVISKQNASKYNDLWFIGGIILGGTMMYYSAQAIKGL